MDALLGDVSREATLNYYISEQALGEGGKKGQQFSVFR